MMKSKDIIHAHDVEASQYDQQVREYNAYAHDVLFGMSFEYVHPHDRLLDIGIGTGLASLPFAAFGLEVYGLDGSSEMLKVCESKAFAKDLKKHDLQSLPLPYSAGFFDHVISCGVFHFYGDLEPIVGEVLRISKPGGIFAYTIAADAPGEKTAAGENDQWYSELDTVWGVKIFTHSDRYVNKLLHDHGLNMLKEQKILLWSGDEKSGDLLFKACIARRAKP